MTEPASFDLVFVCHEKDAARLRGNLAFAKQHVLGYRKIFIVSQRNFFPDDPTLEFVDEKLFPFTLGEIARRAYRGRAGWYFQQFLKLYFLRVMDQRALESVLIIDADCTFIRDTHFFEGATPLYNYEIAFHQPYYDILEKIFGFGRQEGHLSGTVHHMVYQKRYINEILQWVKEHRGRELWEEILAQADQQTISGCSEQELYFSYMLHWHKDAIKVRRIKFIDFPHNTPRWVKLFSAAGYHYIAAHDYLQNKKFGALKCLLLEVLKIGGAKIILKRWLLKLGLKKVE